MAAGSIIVELLARTASFETDTARAAKRLKAFEKQAVETGRVIGVAFAAGAGLAVVAFDQLVKGAANFKDLEETTGASAEALASLAVAAATAGVPIEEVAAATIKLTKNLTGVDDESKAAGAALAALGIPLQAFKALDPVGQIDALTKAFASFADGSAKTAVAVALWGKAGAEQLKVMKALEEAGGRTTILTQQQIELADRYADAQAKATAQIRLYAQAAATQMLPALTDLTKAVRDAIGELIGIDKQTGKLASDRAIQEFAEGGAIAIGRLIDGLITAGRTLRAIGGSFQSVAADIEFLGTVAKNVTPAKGGAIGLLFEDNRKEISAALENRNRVQAEADQRYIDLLNTNATAISDSLRRGFAQQDAIRKEGLLPTGDFARLDRLPVLKPPKPVKTSKTPKGPTDDPTKQLLDNRLKDLQAAFDRERDLLGTRNKFLDTFNAQGLLSIQGYYDAQRAIIDEATVAQAAAIDKQIEALRKFQQAPGRKKTDQADAEGKVNDLLIKRADLLRDAGERGIEIAIKQGEAERRLAEDIQGVSAQVLELQGNLGAAAAIRFDAANLDLVRRLMTQGNDGALALVATLKRAEVAQAEFAEKVVASTRVSDALGAAEDRIAIARQLGATTELGALQQLGAARQAAVVQLETIVQAQEAVARASQNPALVAEADKARLALERLRAEADPLRDKFNSIFEGGLGDAFADFITGASSAKDAIKSFADSVVQQISRIIAQNAAQALFGKGGPLGELGGFVGGVFGGGGAGAGAAAGTFGGGLGGLGGPILNLAGGRSSAALGKPVDLAAEAMQDAFRGSEIAARNASEAIGNMGGASAAASGVLSALPQAVAVPAQAAATAAQTAAFATLTAATTVQTTTLTAAVTAETAAQAAAVASLAALTGAASAAAAALSAVAASSAAKGGTDALGSLAGLFFGVGAAPYAAGGFTGNFGRMVPAGVVHGGEFVISAPAVEKLGVPFLERLHSAGKGSVPGLAGGGHVPAVASPSPALLLERLHAPAAAIAGFASGGHAAVRSADLTGFLAGGPVPMLGRLPSAHHAAVAPALAAGVVTVPAFAAGGLVPAQALRVPAPHLRGFAAGGHVSGGHVPAAVGDRLPGFALGGTVPPLARIGVRPLPDLRPHSLPTEASPTFSGGGRVLDRIRAKDARASGFAAGGHVPALGESVAYRLPVAARVAVHQFADGGAVPLPAIRIPAIGVLPGFSTGGHVRAAAAIAAPCTRLPVFALGGAVPAAGVQTSTELPSVPVGGHAPALPSVALASGSAVQFAAGGYAPMPAAHTLAIRAPGAVADRLPGFARGGYVPSMPTPAPASRLYAPDAIRGFAYGGLVPAVALQVPAAPSFVAGGRVLAYGGPVPEFSTGGNVIALPSAPARTLATFAAGGHVSMSATAGRTALHDAGQRLPGFAAGGYVPMLDQLLGARAQRASGFAAGGLVPAAPAAFASGGQVPAPATPAIGSLGVSAKRLRDATDTAPLRGFAAGGYVAAMPAPQVGGFTAPAHTAIRGLAVGGYVPAAGKAPRLPVPPPPLAAFAAGGHVPPAAALMSAAPPAAAKLPGYLGGGYVPALSAVPVRLAMPDFSGGGRVPAMQSLPAPAQILGFATGGHVPALPTTTERRVGADPLRRLAAARGRAIPGFAAGGYVPATRRVPAIHALGIQALDQPSLPGFARGGHVPSIQPLPVPVAPPLPAFAAGGLVEPGPEFFAPRTAGAIPQAQTAKASAQREMRQENHFHIQGPIDRRTQEQIGAIVFRAGVRANMRGN